MLKMFSRKLKNKKGFSLVELIVVIAILAILGSVALPRMAGFQDNAKESNDLTLAKTVHSVVSAYNASHYGTELAAGDLNAAASATALASLIDTNQKFQSTKHGKGLSPAIAYDAGGNVIIMNKAGTPVQIYPKP